MAKLSVRWLVMLTLGPAVACGDDGSEPSGMTEGGSDTGTPDDDTTTAVTTTGQTLDGTTTDDPPPIEWEFPPVFGVINADDDDANGTNDWYQPVFDGEDDVSTLAIPPVPDGYSVHLSMVGDLANARVWNGPGAFALGSGNQIVESYEFTPSPEGAELLVEFGSDNVFAGLSITLLDEDGAEVATAPVELRSSPLILNHHLQPTEHVWVVAVNAGWGTNADMVAVYEDVLGDHFTPVPGPSYGNDVWIQDEIQPAYGIGDQGQRADTIIDSIRDRELDPFAENELEGPDVNVRTWGNPAQVTSWDSFGNLENSPPVTVDGVDYPLGRIYYGRQGDLGIHGDMAAQLVAQEVQAPFELDTLWLCVGHVDEFATFVPDPDSPKGFKLLLADVPSAWALLESLPPDMALPRYGADHGYDTVGELLVDAALRNLNDDLQADELDVIREVFVTELGLEESDIVYMPSLFETIGGCGGGVAALIPGMVNLIVSNLPSGETHLFVPDPYFRTDLGDQGSDPVIDAFTANLPDSLVPHYVDDWDVYHLGLGEVHCGTNMTRTPIANWWEVALHLL
ncbi:protein-arginine deiminase family protein [Paraliomyxa miuraensis]|uniref:protein-arginine deiminase family protein n=1 Tax=Paraliomyxa miuraensis TaxID=376150 RepID=UPI0022593DF7|nr:protein-arginine deiminase family protein [Paraliomyxa miuraensis]MCX4241010.1 protein-arginine deiminase domain-containing protein [Paraliomyxa miuraensis]